MDITAITRKQFRADFGLNSRFNSDIPMSVNRCTDTLIVQFGALSLGRLNDQCHCLTWFASFARFVM
jgi:hypothetical protein